MNRPETVSIRDGSLAFPPGGIMRWRMQAKGYPAGLAWFWETNWVYGIGAVGYGIYLLLAWILSWLTGNLHLEFGLFHGFVWAFFVVAHLPDLLPAANAELDVEAPSARAAQRPAEEPSDPAGCAPPAASAQTVIRAGWWHLLPALLIAAVNLAVSTRSEEVRAVVSRQLTEADPWLLIAFTQLAIVASAYAVHATVNLVLLLAHWLATPASAAKRARVRRGVPPAATTRREPKHSTVSQAGPPVAGAVHGPPRESPTPTPVSSSSRLPLARLVEYLRSLPAEELGTTLRFIGAVATGDTRRLATPLLVDDTHYTLCHRDGAIDAVALARFLQHFPRIREFVPRTPHGTRRYRPVAQRLRSALVGLRIPAWDDWSTALDSELKRFVDLIRAAPLDQPIVLLCLAATHPCRARILKQILDHHLRCCALRHLVRVVARVVDPRSIPRPNQDLADPPAVLAGIEVALANAGIREPAEPPPILEASEVTEASVIVLADPTPVRPELDRWMADPTGDPMPQQQLVSLVALEPARFDAAAHSRGPDSETIPLLEWLHSALALVAQRILPVLHAKAGEFPMTFIPSPTRFEPPRSREEITRVAAFRRLLEDGCAPKSADRGDPSPERLLPLVWALAQRDGTMLMHTGLPPELADRADAGNAWDDGMLWACLRHAAYLNEVIPPNRGDEYRSVARWLQRCLDQSPTLLPGREGLVQ